jgi:C-terminal processing protease CtpA/Prc
VTSIAPEADAARAGVAVGDVLVKIDAASTLDTGFALNPFLRDRVGQTVKLTIRRGSQEKVIESKVFEVELLNFRLVELPNLTANQSRTREEWLKR